MNDVTLAFQGLERIGVIAALFVGSDGLLIETVTCNDKRIDLEAATAFAASALEASKSMASALARTRVENILVELANGGAIVLQRICDDVAVAVLIDTVKSLGLLRIKLRRLTPLLSALFEPRTSTHPRIEETNEAPDASLGTTGAAAGPTEPVLEVALVTSRVDDEGKGESPNGAATASPGSYQVEAETMIRKVVTSGENASANGHFWEPPNEPSDLEEIAACVAERTPAPIELPPVPHEAMSSLIGTTPDTKFRDLIEASGLAEPEPGGDVLALPAPGPSASDLGHSESDMSALIEQPHSLPVGVVAASIEDQRSTVAVCDEDLVLTGAHLELTGLVATATVELAYGHQCVRGKAVGRNAKERYPFLIAEATARAVTELLSPGYGVVLHDIQPGPDHANWQLCARVLLITPTEELSFDGTTPLGGNLSEAAVKVVLNAVREQIRPLLKGSN